MNRTLSFIFACLTFALILATPLLADCADLGSFPIQQPKLTVEYTKPVKIELAALSYLGQNGGATDVCIKPIMNTTPSPVYNAMYEISSGSCGAPAALQPGKYALTLSASDASGTSTQPNPPDCRTFTITGLTIALVTPPTGMGTTNPVPVTLRTYDSTSGTNVSKAATCKWLGTNTTIDPTNFSAQFSSMTAMTTTGNSTHALSYPGRGTLQVLCQETGGRFTYASFTINFDATPPAMNVTVLPPNVTDPGRSYASILIATDDRSVCTIRPPSGTAQRFPRDNANDPEPAGPAEEDPAVPSTYQTGHETVVSFANITDAQARNFTYTLTCTNLAGLSTTRIATIRVQLDGSLQITSPPDALRNGQFTLEAVTTFEPSICIANGTTMTETDIYQYSADFDLPDGSYALNVTCRIDPNIKTVSRIKNIVIDSMLPTAPSILANNSICGGQITARFASTDPVKTGSANNSASGVAYYNYTVTDGSWTREGRTNGLVTIPVPATLSDQVTWTVFAVDNAGNEGDPEYLTLSNMHEGEDEECGGSAFITLLEPAPPGFSSSQQTQYNVRIGTTRPATCNYQVEVASAWSTAVPFQASSDRLSHSKTVSFQEARIKVNCTETAAGNKQHQRIFMIGRDPTRPVINVDVAPSATVVDRISNVLTITATTDDPTYCYLNQTPFSDLSDTDQNAFVTNNVMILDLSAANEGLRTYAVLCKNLAGLNSTVQQNILIDYSQQLQIAILAPGNYTTESDPQLQARPNKQSTCTYKMNATDQALQFTDISNGVHSVPLGNLNDGSHSIIISCTSIAEGEVGSRIADFTIDRSAPYIDSVQGPTLLCANQSNAAYTVEITTIDPRPIISYTMTGPANAIFASNSSSNVVTISTTGLALGIYTVTFTAHTHGGTQSPPYPIELELLSSTSGACTVDSDHCQNGQLDTGEDGVDCGGTCAAACILCVSSFDCPARNDCVGGVCLPPAGSCTNTSDCPSGHVCRDDLCIIAPVCEINADCPSGQVCSNDACVRDPDHCANNLHDSDEQGVDCGGECSDCISCTSDAQCGPLSCDGEVCVDGPECTTNADCPSGELCTDEMCVIRIDYCTDGIKNFDEIGVDCGGSCDACIVCSGNANCPEQDICSSGVCQDERPECTSSDECPNSMVCQNEVCVELSECTNDGGCTEDMICTEGICVRPANHCTNSVRDNGETGIDCGGECAACTACFDEEADCPSGEACTQDVCVVPRCETNTDCDATEICMNNACVSRPFCEDGMQNNGEENIDCGGECDACIACSTDFDCGADEQCRNDVCVLVQECFTTEDCSGGKVCAANICVTLDSCTDGIRNGDEENIDCGGRCDACISCTTPSECPSGDICQQQVCVDVPACVVDDDCPPGNICANDVCVLDDQPSCRTNDDCDPGHLCAIGYCVRPVDPDACLSNDDCPGESLCFAGVCVNPPPVDLCTDGALDGDETGLDCGGSCGACTPCVTDDVCGNSVCIEDVCVDPGTHDECTDDTQCPGQACISGICIGEEIDFCTDGMMDNGEQDIDCGGSCAACVTCSGNTDCDGMMTCSDTNVCVPEEPIGCMTNNDCEPGYLCAIGYCVQPTTPSSCENTAGCPWDSVCFAGVCVNPPPVDLCTDGALDGDETGLDCGGSCSSCTQCVSDDTCGASFCIQDVCVDPIVHDECLDDAECPGQACISGICIGEEIDFCTDGMLDNDEENIDCGGSCAACVTCSGNTDCAGEMTCGDTGVCVLPERASCYDLLENGDEEGVDCGGRCGECSIEEQPSGIDDGTGPDDGNPLDPLQSGSNLLAYLFMAIGISIMLGSGYFLHQQNEEKKVAAKQAAQSWTPAPSRSLPPPPSMNPEMAAKYEHDKIAREAALKQAYDQKLKEKEQQRKTVFNAFDDKKPAADAKAIEKKPDEPQKKADQKTDAKSDDKSTEKKTEAKADDEKAKGKAKKEPAKDDAFDALDKLSGGK